MTDDLLYKALEATQKGQNYAFATIVEATLKGTPRKSGAKMIVFEDGASWGTIGGGRNEKAAIAECLKVIKSQKPTTVTYNYFGREGESVCGGQMKVFIEPFVPKIDFIICGAGHIALPLSLIGKMLNFKVTVIDSRKEFANKKRFPHVDKILLGDHAKELAKLAINRNTYIAVVTHGNEHDFECLKAIVRSNAAYIGVISSKPKRAKFFARLKEAGIEQKYFKNINIPMGLDIGAQTPTEIAISITAEIVALKDRDYIGTDKFKEKGEIKMTKEEAIDIVRDAGFGFLATMEGSQPRIRPMMPYLTDDGELLLALLGRSRTIDQIKKNPNVEVCFVDRKMWYCRISGHAEMSNDISKKEIVFENVPMLRQYFAGADDANYFLAVVKIKTMEAMTPHSRLPEQIAI